MNRIRRQLQAGVVDAAVNSMQFCSTSRHFQVAKYFSVTQHSMASGVLVFSKQVWDTLPRSGQDAIRSAPKESVRHMRKLWNASEASARGLTVACGAPIMTDVDGNSFAEALVPLHPTLVTSPRLRRMVAEIEARTEAPLQ